MLGFQGGVSIPLVKGGVKAPPAKRQCRAAPKAWLDAALPDMEQARTQVLYRQLYWARGQAENEMKDHKRYWKSDRTSCHRFEANQFRVFLHSAAYVLLDTLRREVFRSTPWAIATMETMQLRLLKLGARVHECTDRINISLPSWCPVAPVLRRSLTLLACVRLT
jgi:hypothetical protein